MTVYRIELMPSGVIKCSGDRVKGVRGTWLGKGDMKTNFDAYRAARAAGKSSEEAAASTKTGIWAKDAGFSTIKTIEDTIDRIVVEFTK